MAKLTEHRAQVNAAAWAAAAALGTAEAVRLLQEAVEEVRRSEWRGPGSR